MTDVEWRFTVDLVSDLDTGVDGPTNKGRSPVIWLGLMTADASLLRFTFATNTP
jgi:hypothetical protein